MCVQELDFDCAKTFNESLSREGNYDFKYKRRTGEDKSDGLCVYWNKLCWTCIHYTDVEFYHYDKDPLMDRHNVAQISVLKELSSGKIVIVANTHLLFNPKRGDVKFRQLEILLRELTKVHQKFTDSYVLLMGDFNSVPGSAMYEFLSKGQLSTIHLRDRKLISGQWNSKTMREYDQIEWTFDKRHLGRGTCMRLFQNDGKVVPFLFIHFAFSFTLKFIHSNIPSHTHTHTQVEIRKSDDTSDRNDDNKIIRHELSLQSAYSESGTMMTTGEPAFTTYHSRFKGTVDYIWFGNGLNCIRVLEMIPKTTLDRFRGLPSSKWSSDHMSLCVEFEFLSSPSLKSEKYEKQQYTKVKIDEDEWPSL